MIKLKGAIQLAIIKWHFYGYCFIDNFGFDRYGETYQHEIIKELKCIQ